MTLSMLRSLRVALVALTLACALQVPARAQGGCLSGGTGGCSLTPSTPEVDPSLAGGGLALLGGAVLVLRARQKG